MIETCLFCNVLNHSAFFTVTEVTIKYPIYYAYYVNGDKFNLNLVIVSPKEAEPLEPITAASYSRNALSLSS
jgi:hypothetical protein